MRPRNILPPIVSCMVLAACSTPVRTDPPAPQTQVAYQSVVSASTRRYELEPGENSTQPKLIENPEPVYPIAMIPAHLPHVVVRAKIVVDKAGSVAQVQLAQTPGAQLTAFEKAVREATSKWRYTPLEILRWRDEINAQGEVVGSHQVATESRPFSLDYEFHFDLRDGKPVVASTRADTQ